MEVRKSTCIPNTITFNQTYKASFQSLQVSMHTRKVEDAMNGCIEKYFLNVRFLKPAFEIGIVKLNKNIEEIDYAYVTFFNIGNV